MTKQAEQPAVNQAFLDSLSKFSSMGQVLIYFEIDAESSFVEHHQLELLRRFNGNLILSKANDWFSARRALKNAYCRINRSQLDKSAGRSACRGCTSCERR